MTTRRRRTASVPPLARISRTFDVSPTSRRRSTTRSRHRRLADADDSLDELLAARDRVEESEADVDALRAEREDPRRQLTAANWRIDGANEIAERVRARRSAEQRRREAGIVTRVEWWVVAEIYGGSQSTSGTHSTRSTNSAGVTISMFRYDPTPSRSSSPETT